MNITKIAVSLPLHLKDDTAGGQWETPFPVETMGRNLYSAPIPIWLKRWHSLLRFSPEVCNELTFNSYLIHGASPPTSRSPWLGILPSSPCYNNKVTEPVSAVEGITCMSFSVAMEQFCVMITLIHTCNTISLNYAYPPHPKQKPKPGEIRTLHT